MNLKRCGAEKWDGISLRLFFRHLILTLLLLCTFSLSSVSGPAFAATIAGNDTPGTTTYPNGGLTHVGTMTLINDRYVQERNLQCAVIDPAGGFAYFVPGNNSPERIIKIDLPTFTRAGTLTLSPGEDTIESGVIDPAAGFAYFGTAYRGYPARIIKIDLKTFTRVGAITLADDEQELQSAVIDSAAGFAYFGTSRHTGNAAITYPGRVVKIDLKTFARVGAITLLDDEHNLVCAVIDPGSGFAYFGAGSPVNEPARVVKIDLSTFTRVGRITGDGFEEQTFLSAVLDPAAGFAYFGSTWGFGPARVVKINLESFTRVGAIVLNEHETYLGNAVIDPAAGLAYFGSASSSADIVKIDLATFKRVAAIKFSQEYSHLHSMVLDPIEKFIYFGNFHSNIGKVGLLGPRGLVSATRFTMPERGAISAAHLYSHTSGGNVRLAIYGDSAIRWRLWESASTSNTKTNDWINIPVSSGAPEELILSAGAYWLAWQTDSAEPVGSYAIGNPDEGFVTAQTYGPFPDGFDSSTLTSTSDRWSTYVTYEPRAAAEWWTIYQ